MNGGGGATILGGGGGGGRLSGGGGLTSSITLVSIGPLITSTTLVARPVTSAYTMMMCNTITNAIPPNFRPELRSCCEKSIYCSCWLFQRGNVLSGFSI